MRIISGEAGGRTLFAPSGLDTRPTSDKIRGSMFNIIGARVVDARVLDLFGGSGALGLEALSRGAAFAVIADRDRDACRIEKLNAEALGFMPRVRLMRGDWERTVQTLTEEGEKFDLLFLDPPYEMTDLREMTERLKPLTAEEGRIVLEHRAGAKILTAEGLRIDRERAWGYCGVKIYEWVCDSGVL